ncbi:MAG TPA: hypothetical protein VF815_42380 [Myxococcaceae bacterium]|jgi:hypothetical protein
MKFSRAVRSSTLLLVVAGTVGCGSVPPPAPTRDVRASRNTASCSSRDGSRDCYCGTCGCWSAATTCGCDRSNGELSCSPTARR